MGVGRRQVAIAVTVILVAVVYVFITGISDTMVYTTMSVKLANVGRNLLATHSGCMDRSFQGPSKRTLQG